MSFHSRMKQVALFVALIFVLVSTVNVALAYEKEIKGLSSAMAEKIVKANKKTIAVVDFTDLQGNVTELGRFLAEEFSVAMAGAGEGFEVVDRTHLKSLLQEHKLAMTGLIDPSTARKLGEIAGVQALITGTITPFGDSVRLSVKVLDTGTAKVIVATAGDIPKTKAIEELLARGIQTGEPIGPQPPPGGEVPPVLFAPYGASASSKKIGDMIITMKGVTVSSKDDLRAIIDVLNQSDKDLKFAVSAGDPSLTDEKGNPFYFKAYSGGSQHNRGGFRWTTDGIALNAKSNAIVVLYFEPRGRRMEDIKEIGAIFAVSLDYVLYNPRDKSESNFSVSFTDTKAQLPK